MITNVKKNRLTFCITITSVTSVFVLFVPIHTELHTLNLWTRPLCRWNKMTSELWTDKWVFVFHIPLRKGPSWPISCCSWIYNYLCNQCRLSLKLWVRIPLMVRCTRYNDLIKLLVSDLRQIGGFFSVSSTNKTDRHDMAEIVLKVA